MITHRRRQALETAPLFRWDRGLASFCLKVDAGDGEDTSDDAKNVRDYDDGSTPRPGTMMVMVTMMVLFDHVSRRRALCSRFNWPSTLSS